jgi:protein-disulfide isomerase
MLQASLRRDRYPLARCVGLAVILCATCLWATDLASASVAGSHPVRAGTYVNARHTERNLDSEVSGRPPSSVAQLFGGIPQSGNRLGLPTAPIVLDEFVDLLSPISAIYTSTFLPKLVNRYVSRGVLQMNLELLDFLGSAGQSNEVARFAEATGDQDLLWDFTDEFFAHQGPLASPYATQQFVQAIAAKVPGLNVSAAATAALAPAAQEHIDQAEQFADSRGIEGVPTILIGRRGGRQRILGLSTVHEYETVIQNILHPKRHANETA